MRISLFLFLLLTISGCDKRTDAFVFDCVIFDAKINAAVAGAQVTMLVQRASGSFNPNYETVGSATTDGNGRFYIEVDKEVFYSYRLIVNHSQHFEGVFDINPDDVPFSTAYANTFNIEPKAWISTHVLNQNGSQAVTFRIEAESNVCTACCTDANRIIQGFPVDTVFTCQVYGGQTAEIIGNYLDENGAVHQILETVQVLAFDTNTVHIIY